MAYVRQHPEFPLFRIKKGIMPDFSGSQFVDQEVPGGIVNGVNRSFTLNNLPLKNSESIYKDGMKMVRSSSMLFKDGDYYIDYQTGRIVFSETQVPQEKSVIVASYKYLGGA